MQEFAVFSIYCREMPERIDWKNPVSRVPLNPPTARVCVLVYRIRLLHPVFIVRIVSALRCSY